MVSDADDAAAIAAIQEAEFRAQSAVTVREQYKDKLRLLVDALQPSGVWSPSPPLVNPSAATIKKTEKKKKTTRDAVADRLRMRATLPAGKELQVLGDWLLLLRAASVNVVESVVHWRHVVHGNRPIPFEAEHARGNYLLLMMDDVDFLEQCKDLIEWLGFSLARNPFIVNWNNEVDCNAPTKMNVHGRGGNKPRRPPPQSLVKPLVSILPEDEVVDGSRIRSALDVLEQEEALFGSHRVSRTVEQYLAQMNDEALNVMPGTDEENDRVALSLGQSASRSVFDEIAVATKSVKTSEHRLVRIERYRLKVATMVEQLEGQIVLTTKHQDSDLSRDHTVWQFRDHCRQATLRAATSSLATLRLRYSKLDDAVASAEAAVTTGRKRMVQLENERERARRERLEKKRQQLNGDGQEQRRAILRQKTLERNRVFKAARPSKHRPAAHAELLIVLESEKHDDTLDFANAVGHELFERPDADQRVELDNRRLENQEKLEAQRIARQEQRNIRERKLNRRRDENARMFLEDRRAQMIEQRLRLARQKMARQERIRKLASVPIFSTVQELGGVVRTNGMATLYRVAVYEHRAKGYTLEGLRFVAYDPSTCRSFAMLITTREYNALGYGRTQEGLAAFCQWLCLIYERRQRQFKLVWSGSPCPPPLRVREYDHALVCVHKEGLRLHGDLGPYRVVAAYARTSDPSKLQLMVSSMAGEMEEMVVRASTLLPTRSMVLKTDGSFYAAWTHVDDPADVDLPMQATRVYSGMLTVNREPLKVHVFDVSSTEYELQLISTTSSNASMRIVLLKQQVNPYTVRLPNSAFGDLLDNLRIDKLGVDEDGVTQLRAHVQPAWRSSLAKYVRALRMGKFGCRIVSGFFLVIVTLVQQKTEFRAHVLFELVCVSSGNDVRQSLRISLSDLFRCHDSGVYPHESDGEKSCCTCAANVRAQAERLTHAEDDGGVHCGVTEDTEPCEACGTTQRRRHEVLSLVLQSSYDDVGGALHFLYYATCETCGASPPPICVLLPRLDDDDIHASAAHCFHTFDIDERDDTNHTDYAAIAASLEHSRVVAVRHETPSVLTTDSTIHMVDQFLQRLYPSLAQVEPPISVAVVAKPLDITQLTDSTNTTSDVEFAIEAALRGLGSAILHISEAAPVVVDEVSSDDPTALKGAFTFETYLVSEALMVEATRVLLHPELEWRLPGETVGASSWATACEFMRDPRQLAWNLQENQAKLINMAPSTRQLLLAYEAHVNWPTRLEDVRIPFRPLLMTVAHVMHVQHLMTNRGVVLACSDSFEATGEVVDLERRVSIITVRNN